MILWIDAVPCMQVWLGSMACSCLRGAGTQVHGNAGMAHTHAAQRPGRTGPWACAAALAHGRQAGSSSGAWTHYAPGVYVALGGGVRSASMLYNIDTLGDAACTPFCIRWKHEMGCLLNCKGTFLMLAAEPIGLHVIHAMSRSVPHPSSLLCMQMHIMRTALGRLAAWAQACRVHARSLARRSLAGMLRAVTYAWATHADAETHWHSRLARRCLQEWRRAAEQQVGAH